MAFLKVLGFALASVIAAAVIASGVLVISVFVAILPFIFVGALVVFLILEWKKEQRP